MKQFLPISRADMQAQGMDQLDFVYVIGDAYVDHPSFGHAIIRGSCRQMDFLLESFHSRLEKSGTASVSWVSQKIGFIVTGGNMDSWSIIIQFLKKRRQKDAFTPGGIMGPAAGLRNRGILQSHPPHLQTHTADHWRTGSQPAPSRTL